MKRIFFVLVLFLGVVVSWGNDSLIDKTGTMIKTRIHPPKGFKRIRVSDGSFGEYLRNLPLKSPIAKVKYYNGKIKENNDIYIAVVDMDIGKKNLQQCADAIMRLYGEYLYNCKKFNHIHFNLTNGFNVDFRHWINGYRVLVKNNKTKWTRKTKPDSTYKNFRRYMDFIFTYAGTYSLAKEMRSVDIKEMKIGNVFIHGGFPGHGVIIVDIAINNETNEKIFLLAQSYMPAQDIQILQNPNDTELSPWYSVNLNNKLITPEWEFEWTELKKFNDE